MIVVYHVKVLPMTVVYHVRALPMTFAFLSQLCSLRLVCVPLLTNLFVVVPS